MSLQQISTFLTEFRKIDFSCTFIIPASKLLASKYLAIGQKFSKTFIVPEGRHMGYSPFGLFPVLSGPI
jgi:hypothetical protein